MPRHRPYGVTSDTAAVNSRIEEDVDARVTVVRVVLLAILDEPDYLALDENREAGLGGIVEGPALALGLVPPPPADLGGSQNPQQLRNVVRYDRTQHYLITVQLSHSRSVCLTAEREEAVDVDVCIHHWRSRQSWR